MPANKDASPEGARQKDHRHSTMIALKHMTWRLHERAAAESCAASPRPLGAQGTKPPLSPGFIYITVNVHIAKTADIDM